MSVFSSPGTGTTSTFSTESSPKVGLLGPGSVTDCCSPRAIEAISFSTVCASFGDASLAKVARTTTLVSVASPEFSTVTCHSSLSDAWISVSLPACSSTPCGSACTPAMPVPRSTPVVPVAVSAVPVRCSAGINCAAPVGDAWSARTPDRKNWRSGTCTPVMPSLARARLDGPTKESW